MFNEVCETPGILQTIYIFKLLFKIICILVPIFIIYGIVKELVKSVLSDQKISVLISMSLKKIAVGVMIFFIPTVFKYIISLANNSNKTYQIDLCYKNATIENIKYYKSLEAVEMAVYNLEKNPNQDNLANAQKALQDVLSTAKEDSILDYQARITQAESRVDENNKIIECKNQGGLYTNGYCLQSTLAKQDDIYGGGSSSGSSDSGSSSGSGSSEYTETSGSGGIVGYDSEYNVVKAGISLRTAFRQDMDHNGGFTDGRWMKYGRFWK